jgi:N-acetylmuramoyl-L-alanine amidase
MKKRKEQWKIWGIVLLMFAGVIWATVQVNENKNVLNITQKNTKERIVIDAGHGGFDPGKVGTAGTLEKDINLSIACKLKEKLVDSGYEVIMTREDDRALGGESNSSKKLSDLKSRVSIINEQKPALAVSIHQNSYSANTKGAQVFYYKTSEESKEFAAVLQSTIKETLADGNERTEKGNDSYYMLKKTEGIFAIVECGFLSNPDEEALLQTEEYQEKMAEAIAEGMETYLYRSVSP